MPTYRIVLVTRTVGLREHSWVLDAESEEQALAIWRTDKFRKETDPETEEFLESEDELRSTIMAVPGHDNPPQTT